MGEKEQSQGICPSCRHPVANHDLECPVLQFEKKEGIDNTRRSVERDPAFIRRQWAELEETLTGILGKRDELVQMESERVLDKLNAAFDDIQYCSEKLESMEDHFFRIYDNELKELFKMLVDQVDKIKELFFSVLDFSKKDYPVEEISEMVEKLKEWVVKYKKEVDDMERIILGQIEQ